ncbi:enoyl-ACP reductase FabI [Sulfobacillus harzensis]|uniref:Enoyl-[acyl-carrier-protein] reductase [NADH] n=1 Tax=Sulfobacillus harzensis TaxID=2729629 RepID=A0A7Y0Q2Y3_9FIRM|nr:enoyl-ACP reductase [Sulfobacillus harzensis]NMP22381.1 enoyl-ACP reductase [Sulfobacillus harzensis]
MGLLEGKTALVTGIANKRSIAWGIARAFDREGARLILTYQNDRLKENLDKLVGDLSNAPILVAPLDVSDDGSLTALAERIGDVTDALDVLVHSVAFAKGEDLSGRFLETSREGYHLAQDISAYSLTALVRALYEPLKNAGRASVMAMTYQGSIRVMPNYNVMGVAKAALESSVRYLAFDLGREGIRVNAISAGPIKTLAAAGVKGISSALHSTVERAPIAENITTEDVGNAAVFLASPWSERITGHVLYVDSGFHIMGF